MKICRMGIRSIAVYNVIFPFYPIWDAAVLLSAHITYMNSLNRPHHRTTLIAQTTRTLLSIHWMKTNRIDMFITRDNLVLREKKTHNFISIRHDSVGWLDKYIPIRKSKWLDESDAWCYQHIYMPNNNNKKR